MGMCHASMATRVCSSPFGTQQRLNKKTARVSSVYTGGLPILRRRVVVPAIPQGNLRESLCKAASNGSALEDDQISVNLSAFPEVEFFKVDAIVRPWRLDIVVHNLSAAGILGMTTQDVRGAGVQGGTRERYQGTEHGLSNLVEKSKLEIVCYKAQVDTVVRIIVESAQTGEVGDGKIFVSPVADVVRIRTRETGVAAERMIDGLSDTGRIAVGVDSDDEG